MVQRFQRAITCMFFCADLFASLISAKEGGDNRIDRLQPTAELVIESSYGPFQLCIVSGGKHCVMSAAGVLAQTPNMRLVGCMKWLLARVALGVEAIKMRSVHLADLLFRASQSRTISGLCSCRSIAICQLSINIFYAEHPTITKILDSS